MKALSTDALRKLYLDFFVSKGHLLVKSDSLVPANDPSVLFTSAGMNQFKDHFLGKVKDVRRATSCQKCLRTGDLEEVGRTPFHHTFFEMLGNFSFGDYFKKEAIEWAWEFVSEVLEIDRDKLWISVYEDDAEALDIWKNIIGLSQEKIKKFGQKENFWPSNAITQGPNGPCGPCSEIYYQKDSGESVEVWNLVFTQFDRRDNGILEPLPSKNIDTGMGLERMSSVLQSVDSNFKIDIFLPIVDAVRKSIDRHDEKIVNMIADHSRAVAFCICDGVMPSNDGRGYVVRKLIRRCAHLALAYQPKPFLYKIVSSVASVMEEEYPELLERRDNIAQIIKAEEEKYIKNILEGGSERLNAIIEDIASSGKKELPAEIGLDLYVTYGIQPDFTKEACDKKGIHVDLDKIADLIEKEQVRSRSSSKISGSIFFKDEVPLLKSQFVGYEMDSCKTKVLQIIKDGQEVKKIEDAKGVYAIVLDKTPFYAEAGGQVGDVGTISSVDGHFRVNVVHTKKQGNSIALLIKDFKGGDGFRVAEDVVAEVDIEHREAVKRAHTATHILQSVLRKILGQHVQQAGSLVEPDKFRFDFTHFQDIKPDELHNIQRLLNYLVIRNDSLMAQVMPKLEAQKTGAIALFGEKYEDTVRVISIADYSKEFCGGTHLDSTGSIGLVLITNEYSVGSGLRRIEALTGKLAYQKFDEAIKMLNEASSRFKIAPAQFLETLDQFIAKDRSLEKEFLRLREKDLKFEIEDIAKSAKKIKDISVVMHSFKNFDVNLLRRAADFLKARITKEGIFFLSSLQEQNMYFVCGLTDDLVKKGLSADVLVKNILSEIGGSGGGRKDFAQGGTKEVGKFALVLREAEAVIKKEIEGV